MNIGCGGSTSTYWSIDIPFVAYYPYSGPDCSMDIYSPCFCDSNGGCASICNGSNNGDLCTTIFAHMMENDSLCSFSYTNPIENTFKYFERDKTLVPTDCAE